MLPDPDHCYDFVSNSVNDDCGSINLTRVGKSVFILAGNNNTPVCDNSGCQFDKDAHFIGDVPAGMGTTWTIGFWMREVFSAQVSVFSIVKVSPLFLLARAPPAMTAR